MFRYPYGEAQKALVSAPAASDGSRTIRYTNPVTGEQAQPLLDMGMRMGQGTGVMLAWPLVLAAQKLLEH